jgi:sporulation protein YlmC with PRC-barrel domain
MTVPNRTVGHILRSTSASVVSADSVLGCPIVDRQGQKIGLLRDVILDVSTGRIAYAVAELTSGAVADQLVVIPWNAVYADLDVHQLRVNAHADWIERAPAVHRGSEADRFVHEWGAFIHNYFGTTPYWEGPRTPQHS